MEAGLIAVVILGVYLSFVQVVSAGECCLIRYKSDTYCEEYCCGTPLDLYCCDDEYMRAPYRYRNPQCKTPWLSAHYWAVVLVILGLVVGVTLAVFVAYYCYRKKQRRNRGSSRAMGRRTDDIRSNIAMTTISSYPYSTSVFRDPVTGSDCTLIKPPDYALEPPPYTEKAEDLSLVSEKQSTSSKGADTGRGRHNKIVPIMTVLPSS